MKKLNNYPSFWCPNVKFGRYFDIGHPKYDIGHPLSCRVSLAMTLAFFTLFSTVLTAQPITKTYPDITNSGGTAIAEYNNGANFLINDCDATYSKATYYWTNAQGDLLNTERDFDGSCGQYRIDADTYIKAQSVGTEPNRDFQFQKLRRDGSVVFTKNYPLPLDNIGQFVIPTTDGFLLAGSTQIVGDSLPKIQLIKTDVAGNAQWTKIITQGLVYSTGVGPNGSPCNPGSLVLLKSIRLFNAFQTSDGGFCLFFDRSDIRFACGFGGGYSQHMIRLDANGNFLFAMGESAGSLEGKTISATSAENGNLIVLMGTGGGDSRTCLFNAYNLMKVNPLGVQTWSFARTGANCNQTGQQVMSAFTLTNNGYILAATSSGGLRSVRKINAATGQQMDSLRIELPDYATANKIIETQNKDFVLVGRTNNNGYFYRNNFTPSVSGQICASKSTSPWEYWISKVQFNTINNTSDKFKDINSLGYSDYTNVVTTLIKGETYPLSITPSLSWIGNLSNAYCRVWIDFNKNNAFETDEVVLEKRGENPFTANVVIRDGAILGTTNARMRVAIKNGNFPNPCEGFPSGEVEDYFVNFVNDPNLNPNCRAQDSLELVRLYNATNGANWTNKWNLNAPMTTWFGVNINSNGCVIRVQLNDNNLVGTLPDLSLAYVQSFLVNENKLTGTIPNFDMPNVIALWLNNNQLTGSIPNFNLPKLKFLWLHNNRLTGNIPNFTALPVVEEFYFHYNQLSGALPDFTAVPNIRSLSFNNNNLSGCIPQSYRAYCGLTYTVNLFNNPNITASFNEFCVTGNGGCVTTPPQYCASKAIAPWELWISKVQLNTLNNTSDKFKDFNTLGYSDYTNLNTPLIKGQSYPLSITPSLSWIGNIVKTYCRVWIDFNHNNSFEANELVLDKNNQNPFNQNILVPTTAVIGNTRMRVSVKFYIFPTSCEAFDKGEVEDYLVDIQSGSDLCANDVTPPVFANCPANFTTNLPTTGAGTCYNYTWTPPTATDNCSPTPSVSSNFSPPYCFGRNTTTVIYTATDAKGNKGTCSFDVNVTTDICEEALNSINIKNCPNSQEVFTTTNCAIATWVNPTAIREPCNNSVPITQGFGLASGSCFPLGVNEIVYVAVNGRGDFTTCTFTVTVVRSTASANDLALTLTATPSVYRQYTTQNFKITAKNNSITAFSAVKIKFNRPALTVNGGTKVASIGTFQDYCPGGIECSEWTIPTLAAGATATLDIPVYVLNPSGAITATATLLSSNPVDNNTANNTASVIINSANAPIIQPLNQLLINSKPTQLIPIIIQKIAPTITENYIVVELESIINKTIDFEISNSLGSVVLTEKIVVEKGNNKLHFQVENLPKGMYFIQTSVGKGRGVPMKFVKM
jgi:GEVED domain/Domain of unknown function DUF11/HYR domain